jgi:hypothetical protein
VGRGQRELQLHAFTALGLHRVELSVYAFNPRARRAYEKAGFVAEGVLRDALRLEDGRRVDAVVMAALAPDWLAADRPPQPTTDEPTADQPATDEAIPARPPAAARTTADLPATDETAADLPATDETAAGETAADRPLAGDHPGA